MAKDTFFEIKKLLENKNIRFEHFVHEHVHSSHDAAKIRGNSIQEAAKAIILKVKPKGGDYTFIQCVLSGDRRINLKVLKKEFNFKSAALASPEEVLNITGCTIGSVPPFGPLFNLPTFIDKHIFDNDFVVFSAGTHNDSIKILSKDYKEVINREIYDFSEKI